MKFKEMAENAGLTEDEFLEIVRVFVDATTADLKRLRTAVANDAPDEVVEAAHSIKGSAINFGFRDIEDVARNIEMNARKSILDGAGEGAGLLEGMLRTVEHDLDEWASSR
jgi:HPt (histidine-containing phosphotransfer) domain-containing protein